MLNTDVPGIDVLIEINRMFIEASGEQFIGTDNLLNRSSLEYVLEQIQNSVMGHDLFPGLLDKAAVIVERIMVGHVFFGANKRTGLLACATYLEMNGYEMQIFDGERFDQEAIETALAFQNRKMSLEDFTLWIENRSLPIPS